MSIMATGTAVMRQRTRDDGASLRLSRSRMLAGSVAAVLLASCGWWLFRVDTMHGAPLGPDRLLADEGKIEAPAVMEAHGRAALRDRPVDGPAYRVLGLSAAARGDGERAIQLYRIAVRRDPRDWKARAFLMDEAFRRGGVDEGVTHLDAILRVAPDLAEPLLHALAAELGDSRLRRSVVDIVAADPPWASRLMEALRDSSVDPTVAVAFIEDLSTRRTLAPLEHSILIDVLSRAGRAGDARLAWLATLGPRERALAGNVFDGGFEERTPITGEFAWSWDAGPGTDVSLEQGNAASGQQALRIDFNGRAVTLRAPSQRLALAPGRYVLSSAFDDRTDASQPFALIVGCASGGDLARLELTRQARSSWTQVSASFEVPSECTQQRIWLVLRSRSMAGAQVTGTLHLDDVGIRNSLQ